MKAIDIKKQAIEDLQLIINMAIEQAENNICLFDTLDEYKKVKGAKTPTQKEELTHEFIYYSHESEVLNERFSLKYGHFQMNFDTGQAIFLSRKIKNGFGNGKSEQPTKNKRSELDYTSKELQTKIADLRHDYRFSDYLTIEQNESRKKAVISAYKKAEPNDLIRLCWKWITATKNIEGIHIPYSEEPKAIFTPYFQIEKTECKNQMAFAS